MSEEQTTKTKPVQRACEKCGMMVCVCGVREGHKFTCLYRRHATAGVVVGCKPHQAAYCPYCFPCTCNGSPIDRKVESE